MTVIGVTGGTFSGATSGASTLAGTCGATANAPERVFQWTPNRSGVATIATCDAHTNFDTVVYVRQDSCTTGTEIACNNDDCGVASRVRPTVTAGVTYFIVVDGNAGARGKFKLKVTPPP